MKSSEYIDLQLVVVMLGCALMLAVVAIEQGGILVRSLIFSAGLINAIAAIVLIHKERKSQRHRPILPDNVCEAEAA